MPSRASSPDCTQRGVAAVEFALIVTVVLLIFSGAAVYWNWLQTQQTVARATGDGARQLYELAQGRWTQFDTGQASGRQAIAQQVQSTVRTSLQGAGLAAASQAQVQIAWANNTARLEVVYPHTFLEGLLPVSSRPTQLRAQSVVRLTQ